MGGFSTARGRFELYKFAVTAGPVGESEMEILFAPGVLTKLNDGTFIAPVLPRDAFFKGFADPVKATNDFTTIEAIELYARTVLDLQREGIWPCQPGSDQMIHGVGGLAELVILTKDEMTSRILHRWSDRIGEKITPEKIDWPKWRAAQLGNVARLPAPAPGLNRKQRLALAASTRKAARS